MPASRQPGLLAITGCFSLVIAGVCLALALNDQPLTVALGMVIGLSAVLVVLIEPFFGLLLLIAFTYLRPGDRVPMLEELRLVLLLFVGTAGVALAQYLIRRRPRPVRHPVQVPLAGLLLAALVSHFPTSLSHGLNVVINGLFKPIVLAFLVAYLVRTPRRVVAVSWLVVVLSATNAVLAWVELHRGQSGFENRAAGVGLMSDPNDLALTLVIALPLALGLLQAERGFYRRLTLLVALFALVAGILVSQSRGGALGLGVVLFLEGYERLTAPRARRAYAVLGLVVGLAGFGALASRRGHAIGELGDDPNVYNRRGAWVAGWRMLLDKPLTGVGLYRFQEYTDLYGPEYMEQRHLTAHNSVVLVAGELGFPGLICFLLLLGRTWRATRRVRQRLDPARAPPEGEPQAPVSRHQRVLSWAVGRMFVGWFICAMFLSQAYQPWLYLTVGLTIALDELARGEDGQRQIRNTESRPSSGYGSER